MSDTRDETSRTVVAPAKDWRHYAACRPEAVDPEWFFQLNGWSELTQLALSYCVGCPVKIDCLHYAVTNRCWGVWGGIYRPLPDSVEGRKASRERRGLTP